MFRVGRVLTVAAAALSASSGTSLAPAVPDVPLEVGAPLHLDCGVRGHYRHCLWETEDGRVFQVEDVHGGRHAGLRAPSNLSDNQCSIVLEQASAGDAGAWTCTVFLQGSALTTVRNVVTKETRACISPFESVGGGCFYFAANLEMNWNDARAFCKSLSSGADLAVVDDCNLMHLLWNHILMAYGAGNYLLGATDQHEEGTWVWVDGTAVTMGTPFWLYGQPDNQNNVQHYLRLFEQYGGYFDDASYGAEYHFVCQDLQTEGS
ncbi:alpha-N-acetylgalactosamine-specific lectin-like [Eriocheir sinensis]|uniref:alpha-N-acetylgalactosamine-specific lectin-like n=1 Tax=Eriocheir sinensis TaxID=95602 RepID=UPI0021CABFAC|nr:alpha-N-acetylgalactosamine-specific lectin-like [Eriocheir sinensis]